MGHNNRASPAYRDDPDAVSLHTTPDDYAYDDAPEINGLPPSYADSQEGSTSAEPPQIRHIPPPSNRVDHDNRFSMKFGKVQVGETQTIMDARYDTDPIYLEEGIRSLAEHAPIPLVYIMGNHKETIRRGDKKETKDVLDFRIVMDLERYLKPNFNPRDISQMKLLAVENGDKTYRGSITKCRAPAFNQDIEVGVSPPTLTEWCHRYCASPRMLRVFRLQRSVTGLDTDYLKNRLEGLVRSTNYRGRIDISFPTKHVNLDIYTSNRVNAWRMKTWIRWLFYVTFLWIFTWPYLFFATKRYAVVRAIWPFSKTDSHGTKTYTTISEEQWFEKWQIGIRRLVLDRFHGVANDQMLIGVAARPEDPPMPGIIRTGHEGVDNAVGLLSQGFQVARALSQGNNLPQNLQGGWGHDT